MRTLFLHVGHAKTGSSFLQSSFALSRPALRQADIAYLSHGAVEKAAKGAMTNGNGGTLIGALNNPVRGWLMATRLRLKGGNALFRSEFLFHRLSRRGGAAQVSHIARGAGFGRISILLFIRDPFDHLPSLYQQRVKRSGYTGDIETLAEDYDYPRQVARFLRRIGREPTVEITIANYSRRRRRLTDVTSVWLGLPNDALTKPEMPRINRSLTSDELEAQRLFNAKFGSSGRMVSDVLSRRLPEIEAEYDLPSAPAGSAMLARLRKPMRFVNRQAPVGERYTMEVPALPPEPAAAPKPDDVIALTRAQWEAVVEGVAKEVTRRSRS
ncbi:MAG: hypothetical protein AAF367_15195 [Pseudomonadota bacterium]